MSNDNGSGPEDGITTSEEEADSSHYEESDYDSDNGGPIWVGYVSPRINICSLPKLLIKFLRGIPRAPPVLPVKGDKSVNKKNAQASASASAKSDAEKKKASSTSKSSQNPATKSNTPVSGNGKYNTVSRSGK